MNDIPRETLSDLLNRVARHDEQAVTVLYRHYQRQIYAFIRNKLRDHVSAETVAGEVVNDVFLDVCRKPGSYDGSCKFSTWLCAIANHKAIDRMRAHGRRAEHIELDDELAATIPSTDPGILDRLEEDERNEVLRECVNKLSTEHRDAIHMAYYQEMGLDEIATVQQCPENTVKTRLFHARKKVAECVKRALGGL